MSVDNNENIEEIPSIGQNATESSAEPIGQTPDGNSPVKKESFKGFVFFCCILAAIFILFLILNSVVFMRVQVEGPSMENTLFTGDIIVANKLKTADYGDIVIISGEKANGDLLVKRVIAKGGDKLKFDGGKVYLKKSGESEYVLLEETYLKTSDSTYIYEGGIALLYPVVKTVPEGEIFYMGDNREDSTDSRYEDSHGQFSTCGEDQIVGVVENWSLSLRWLNGILGRLFSRKTS